MNALNRLRVAESTAMQMTMPSCDAAAAAHSSVTSRQRYSIHDWWIQRERERERERERDNFPGEGCGSDLWILTQRAVEHNDPRERRLHAPRLRRLRRRWRPIVTTAWLAYIFDGDAACRDAGRSTYCTYTESELVSTDRHTARHRQYLIMDSALFDCFTMHLHAALHCYTISTLEAIDDITRWIVQIMKKLQRPEIANSYFKY